MMVCCASDARVLMQEARPKEVVAIGRSTTETGRIIRQRMMMAAATPACHIRHTIHYQEQLRPAAYHCP